MLEKGLKGRQEVSVEQRNSAKEMKSGTLDVFATPAMVALMEETAWKSVADHLEEGMGSVGTALNIKHLAATPLGMNVWCESELIEVDGRRLVFQVDVFDDAGKVGEGTHERFIVQNEKFQKKADSKNSEEKTMKKRTVWAMYFSPTGTTEKIVTRIAETLEKNYQTFSFNLPEARAEGKQFSEDDLVIFGVPVYAGRVPNVLLKYLATVQGGGALAVPVVLYGNRNYDDGLIELRNILENNGFKTIAAAAFIGEHSFSRILAAGRPDNKDMAIAEDFAKQVAEKLESEIVNHPIEVKGEDPIRPYYQPRDRKGNPVDIRKVKPKTKDNCDDCKRCAEVCPMGSISFDDVREFTGICIKCGACEKNCPKHAKYYDDEGYLYHKTELELGFERRAEPELFL